MDLPAPPAPFHLRPDHGPPLSSLCHLHPGAGDASEDSIRHGIGVAGAGAFHERGGNDHPQLLPAEEAVVSSLDFTHIFSGLRW